MPPRLFLPDEVKPLKEILDVAGGGSPGSPQAVEGRFCRHERALPRSVTLLQKWRKLQHSAVEDICAIVLVAACAIFAGVTATFVIEESLWA